MKLFNVRAGFATNSSSSHSIVMIPRGMNVHNNEYDRFRYGWEQFTLTSVDSKTAYFATQLYQSMNNRDIDSTVAVDLINSLLGTAYTYDMFEDAYVDHQSVWSTNMDEDFIRGLHSFITRSDVVILGGNDNSDPQELDGSFTNELTENITGNWTKIRKDGVNWSMFNHLSGSKIRFSIIDDAPLYTKSSVPELVDIKVTDFCRYGCEFCYQGSTNKGAHADANNLKKIIDSLAAMEVFEIAFGGGEPTHYSNFAEILEYTASKGIVPNFTTFGVDWLRNDELFLAVKNTVGAIGVSVHTADHLSKVFKIKNALGKNNVVAQHVVGSVDIGETALLLEECWKQGVDVLLLGYKNVGFGANVEQHDMTGLDTLLKLRQDQSLSASGRVRWGTKFSMLGVDTAFVQQFDPILDDLNIPKVLKTSEEGKFSMYIDAVALKQGPSSYMPDQMETIDMDDIENSIRTAYKKW